MQFGSAGIVSGAVHGKQRVHAAVPVAHPHARLAAVFILNIKTPAGRTGKSAGAAVDTGKRDIFPERRFIEFVGVDCFQTVGIYKSGYFGFSFLSAGFDLTGGSVGICRCIPTGGID